MRKFLLLAILVFAFTHLRSQNCVPTQTTTGTTINNTSINLACGQPCTSFSYQAIHFKNTTSYLVSTIPFAPRPYIVAGATQDNSLYDDDKYSNLFNLPFSFCFFGTSYNSVVIGSNGLMTFDATNASCANNYVINQTIPGNGGSNTQCSQGSGYYPKAAIMGCYFDWDPRPGPSDGTQASPADREISWRIDGVAPCRKFVITYYHIGSYNGVHTCSLSTPGTMQMVLDEGTGLIEVYLAQKQCPSSTNGSRGIMGMQDISRSLWAVVPGRNNTVFTATNEAYRYTPSAGASHFVKAELYTLGGTLVTTGDTTTTTPGMLDINFASFCPPNNPSTQYVVRTEFNSCFGSSLISYDTITVNRVTTLPATISSTPTTCGASAGSVTVTPTAGVSPYTYTLNGGAPVTSAGAYTFNNLPIGSYTVVVTDAAGCANSLTINVTSSTTITANATSTPTSCPLSPDGTITVTPNGGTAPFNFSLDGGPSQTSNVFTSVTAGPHTITFTDAGGCSGSVTVSVGAGNTPLTANTNTTATSCPGISNGTITVTPTSGSPAYQYSLDGGGFQASNVFNNVSSGFHTVTVKDQFGCTGTFGVNVAAGPALTANVNTTATSCPGLNNGTVTVTPTNGTAAYQYSLDGGPNQPGNLFTNVSSGFHVVTVTDANGCSNTFNANVAAGPALTANLVGGATSCPAVSNGTITVTPTNGTAPYQYALDGGGYQPGNVFTNVAAGMHNVSVQDANGCVNIFSVNVPAGPSLTANVTSTSTSCPVLNDGTITATPTNGTAPYQYSLDAGPFQPGNVFTNVPAGAHNVTVRDANTCSNTFPVNVAQGAALSSTINGTDPPCNNINNGVITITPTAGIAPYQYSLNGGPSQASNTFSGLAPGSYTIDFVDAGGCTGTNSIILTTNPPITATNTNVDPACHGNNNGSITVNASGGVPPYQYSINAGSTYQGSPTFTGLIAGTYNFRVKDAAGCLYDFTFVLNEPPGLPVSSSSTPSSCSNDDGTITINAVGGTPPYQYSIDNGTSYSPTNLFSNLPIGSYDILVKDANGCTSNTTQSIVLNDTMRLDIGPDSTVCFGQSVTMVPQTNPGTNYYKWTTIPTFKPGEIDKDTIGNATITPTVDKKYYVLARWGLCQRTDSITLFVMKKPVSHAGSDTIICAATPAFLHGFGSNFSGPLIYNWTPRIPLFAFTSVDSSQAIVRPDSSMDFVFNVRDNYGCSFSVFDTMRVFIDPPVPAFAGNDTNALLGKPHHMKATGGVAYEWTPTAPLDNPNIPNPTAILYNDTYFRVTVTDAAGCKGSDDVFLKVYDGPAYYLPNAFTPDNNGINDIFYPTTVGMKFTDFFMIYDRYGEIMFQTREFQKGWDGTYKGKPALMGTYVWIIKGTDEKGKVVEMRGTVTLIR